MRAGLVAGGTNLDALRNPSNYQVLIGYCCILCTFCYCSDSVRLGHRLRVAMTQPTPQGNDTMEMRDSGKAIGATLRTARLDSGMSVADVSQTLRISRDFIKMLEAGEFDTLPSPTYVAGYIRSYGAAVGIEPKAVAALVEAYYAQLEDGAATPTYQISIGDQRPRRSGALAARLRFCGCGWLYRMVSDGPPRDD